MYVLPRIHQIRRALEDVEGAIVRERAPEAADRGSGQKYVLKQPLVDEIETEGALIEQQAPSWERDRPRTAEAPTEIFEVPAELDDRDLIDALEAKADGQLSRKVQIEGTDALGWYVPFHYRDFQHGIYISAKGILYLFRECFSGSDLKKHQYSKALNACYHAILRHEAFHFAVECMTAQLELLSGCGSFFQYGNYVKQGEQYHYGDMFEHYTNKNFTYDPFEEALANAYMLRGFNRPVRGFSGLGMYESLKNFTIKQPVGYRDSSRFLSSFFSSCGDLAKFRHEHIEEIARPDDPCLDLDAVDFTGLYPNIKKVDWRRCPVIFVDEDNIFHDLEIFPALIARLDSISESNRFLKILSKMEAKIPTAWQRTKSKLVRDTRIPGLDFKKWPKGGRNCFSVRVTDSVRAHIRSERNGWIAESIGTHKAMGHG